MPEVNRRRVEEHIEDLKRDAAEETAIADALRSHADEHDWRSARASEQADRLRAQLERTEEHA